MGFQERTMAASLNVQHLSLSIVSAVTIGLGIYRHQRHTDIWVFFLALECSQFQHMKAIGTATFGKLPSTTCMCPILMNVPQCPSQIRKLVPYIETTTVQGLALIGLIDIINLLRTNRFKLLSRCVIQHDLGFNLRKVMSSNLNEVNFSAY